MMKKIFASLVILAAAILLFSVAPPDARSAQNNPATTTQTTNPQPLIFDVVGKIVQKPDGYIIKGQVPAEIYRIINPDPAQLDEFALIQEILTLRVKSIVGDNVAIEKINGKAYTSP